MTGGSPAVPAVAPESFSPRGVGEPTIVQLRPLSTLQVGECYALAPDGRMVRAQIAYSPDPAPPSP